jgi:hypothetical protein
MMHPPAACARLALAALSVAGFAVMFPYYGTLNAVIGAITSPLIAFAFPAAAYSYLHWTREKQDASLQPPPRWVLDRELTWGACLRHMWLSLS